MQSIVFLQGKQCFDRINTVLLLERINEIEAGVHFVEAGGIEFDFFFLVGHLLRDILQLDIDTVQTVGQFARRSKDRAQAHHRILAVLQGFEHTAFVGVQRLSGSIKSGLDVFGMGQHLRFLLQLFLLAVGKVGLLQLLQLEADVVFVRTTLLGTGHKRLQVLTGLPPVVVQLLIGGQLGIVVRQQVEHVQLEALLVEQEVLMLGVDIDEQLAQLFHLRQRGRCVVDEGTALTRSIKLAAQDALVFVLQFVGFEERLHAIGRHVEVRLNDAFRSPLADGLHVGTLTQQQADGSQNDGLAGTCLTCYD